MRDFYDLRERKLEEWIISITLKLIPLILIFSFMLVLALLVKPSPIFSPSEQVELIGQTCFKQYDQIEKNNFPDLCEQMPVILQASNENYTGIKIESFNNSVKNCVEISQVLLYYKFYPLNKSNSNCILGVDADNNNTWSEEAIECLEENSEIQFKDVTQAENWTCENFFGNNKALAKAQVQSNETVAFTELYFKINYIASLQPEIRIEPIYQNSYFNVTLNVAGNCNYTLDSGQTNASMSSNDNINFHDKKELGEGNYTAIFFCQDLLGNSNQKVINFSIQSQVDQNTTILQDSPEAEIKIDQPIKWKKKIIKKENDSINIPKSASNVKIKKDNRTLEINDSNLIKESGEYEIEYTLPPPTKEEKEEDNKKIIAISGPEEIKNKNIKVSTNIDEIVQEKRFIKLYSKNEKKFIEFEAFDKDNNDYLDTIEWDSSSNQIYEIIIEIASADHLNSNKEYISSIYDQVRELDQIWSEPIYHEDYIRVVFEKKLDSTKDITLYVKNKEKEKSLIEVYYFNSTEKIAEFPIIKKEGYYKILLTSLIGEQDTFDLKIVNLDNNKNAYLEFEHIIDPSIQADTDPALDTALAALDNRTFVFSWIDDVEDDVSFVIFDTNGTSKTNIIDADTTVNGNSRVSLRIINSTAFILGWYDGLDQDITYSVYSSQGTLLIPATDIETAVGTPAVDLKIIGMNNRFQACFVDDAEDDADSITIPYETWGVGVETNIDTAIGSTLGLQNLFSCTAISNTRFTAFWFDDQDNDATFSIRSETGASIIAPIDIDANVGETGQVAITSLNNDRFAMAWYDSAAFNTQISIRDINNNILLNPTIIDANSGTNSRVAIATIKNKTDSLDWFIVGWNDRNSDNIQASVFDSSGNLKQGPFVLANDENTTSLLFELYGKDPLTQISTCDDKFLFSYTTNASKVIAKTFNIDGTEWTGFCDNVAPRIDDISDIPNQIVTESGITNVLFNIQATDANGVADLNDTSIYAEFTKNSIVRTGSCVQVSDINLTTAQYACTIGINYWDSPGSWAINARIKDYSNELSQQYSESFTLLETACITTNPSFFEWSTLFPGEIDKLANSKITVANTCNKPGNLQIKAFNILGELDSTHIIPASNFTIHTVNACSPSDAGTLISHASTVQIIGASLPAGENAVGNGLEELFICLEELPSNLKAQRYSTLLGSPWEIIIFFAAFLVRRKKNKLSKENILEVLDEKLKEEYQITIKEILSELTKNKIKIPIDIFKQKTNPAESICKYLKENQNLNYSEISKILKRDQRTIWINYRNSIKKEKEKFKIKDNEVVPIEIFSNRKLSILESLVKYLKEKGLRNTEIAKMLNKDPRNVHTLHSRAMKKTK